MAEFDIDLGPLGRSFSKMLNAADDAARDALGLGVAMIVRDARAIAPSGSTSALKNSIRSGGVKGKLSSGSLVVEVIAEAPHAAAHEYGSGLYGEKYPIRPRNKKALRWAVQGVIGTNSGFAFASGVMHPGVKARRYLARAVEQNIDNIERQLAAAVEIAIAGE
jgi:hypothetical protein